MRAFEANVSGRAVVGSGCCAGLAASEDAVEKGLLGTEVGIEVEEENGFAEGKFELEESLKSAAPRSDGGFCDGEDST